METKGNKAAKHLNPGDACWIIENNLYAVCGTRGRKIFCVYRENLL